MPKSINLLFYGKTFIPGKNYYLEPTVITTVTKPYADALSVILLWIILLLALSAVAVMIKCFPPTLPKEFYPDESTFKEQNQSRKNKIIIYICILTVVLGAVLTYYMLSYEITKTIVKDIVRC